MVLKAVKWVVVLKAVNLRFLQLLEIFASCQPS